MFSKTTVCHIILYLIIASFYFIDNQCEKYNGKKTELVQIMSVEDIFYDKEYKEFANFIQNPINNKKYYNIPRNNSKNNDTNDSSYLDATGKSSIPYNCNKNSDCVNGVCVVEKDVNGNSLNKTCCTCNVGYLSVNSVCDYKQYRGFIALMLSIFLGTLGVDRCYISAGNGCAICLGILKGTTCGGCLIWYIIDIILIATSDLYDGNGQPLTPISAL